MASQATPQHHGEGRSLSQRKRNSWIARRRRVPRSSARWRGATTLGAERIRGELLKLGIPRVQANDSAVHARSRPEATGRARRRSCETTSRGRVTRADVRHAVPRGVRTLLPGPASPNDPPRRGDLCADRRVVRAGRPGNATMDRVPQVVVCDHDTKLGSRFAAVLKSSGVSVVRTAIRAPDKRLCFSSSQRWSTSSRAERFSAAALSRSGLKLLGHGRQAQPLELLHDQVGEVSLHTLLPRAHRPGRESSGRERACRRRRGRASRKGELVELRVGRGGAGAARASSASTSAWPRRCRSTGPISASRSPAVRDG